jgi:cystathionine beta-lyase/cystathionine gamma-synthase
VGSARGEAGGAQSDIVHRETLLQHLGEEDKAFGAVTPPIVQTSLFVFDDVDSFVNRDDSDPEGPFVYSRVGNPNTRMLEQKIAMLEGTESCRVFNSGMAAISSSIMCVVEMGAHVVCVDTAYGPTQQFFRDYLPRFGVTTTFVPGISTEEILGAIRPETKLLYLESPSSIIFRLQDFEAITAYCRERGIVTVTDNSYCSPIFQQPARFGVDMVVHSATKYLVGHSDVVAGVAAGRGDLIHKMAKEEVALFGGALAPFPAWLMLRGMRTLPMRMRHAEETGNTIAGWLREQPWVERVFHAGFDESPLRAKQMTGTSSLLSFQPKNQDRAWSKNFVEALDLYQLGVSWGGFESLAVPLEMRPGDWPEKRYVIRLYNGFEHTGDLIADLGHAAEVAGR